MATGALRYIFTPKVYSFILVCILFAQWDAVILTQLSETGFFIITYNLIYVARFYTLESRSRNCQLMLILQKFPL